MATYSPLTDRVMHTSKSESRRGAKVSRVIVHHWAGTAGGIERLVHSADKASSNYIIADGQIIGSVEEELRAWTSGSLAADAPSITIEVQNSSTGGDWPVSDANFRALIRLIADIADRYGWGTLTSSHVRGHREFAATACPGPYLWSRRSQIIKDAQAARGGGAPSKPPATGGGGKSVSQMATEVIAGQHGNGHDQRRRSLGVSASVYAQVRNEVNRRAGVSTPAPSRPAGKSVATMATEVINGKHGNGHANRRRSLGVTAAVYEQVRAEVNRRAGGGGSSRPAGKSVSQMATEVLRGDHGNGHDARRRSLGVSNAVYQQVRAEVNRRA